MSAAIAEAVCEHCGVQEGAVGNWDHRGRWISLAKLFDAPMVVLPVPAREIQLRPIEGRMLCQRCAGDIERTMKGDR